VRVLLDECVDRRLRFDIVGHNVSTVRDERWLGVTDYELLQRAEGRFDALVTVDRRLARQQPIARFSFAVFVLRARDNRYRDLLPLVPRLLEVLPVARPGTATTISSLDLA
jgi:hypothetical protein